MKRPPTDFQLLRAIYKRHNDDYTSYVDQIGTRNRTSKVMVPIDIPAIAKDFGVDVDSVFGRLYFHLDPLYGQERDGSGGRKTFFAMVVGDDKDCVNFPLLEAVLAALWTERNRNLWTLAIAIVSLLVAIVSLFVAIVTG